MKKIFVSIACHNDLDVIPTCKSLLETAANPEQLRLIIILQTDNPEQFALLEKLPVEVHTFPLSWATGVGKPRHYACTLICGETHFLQIDCHMRFQSNWDELLYAELEECPNPSKAILSALPPGFIIETGELLSMKPMAPKLEKFIDIIPVSEFSPIDPALKPQKIPHIAAGLVFCSIETIQISWPDPFYHYHGEELSQSLRWWTNGYTIYAPRMCLCHHAYRGDNTRPTDNVDDVLRHWRSLQRISGLLGAPKEGITPLALIDLELYSLGNLRSVASWEAEFGVNLAARTLS